MRFSLRSLIAAVTATAVVMAFCAVHGLFGLILVLPHLVLFVVVVVLNRYTQRLVATLVAGGYHACWALTAVYGVRAVDEQCLGQFKTTWNCEGATRLSCDPMHVGSHTIPVPPWYFVGNESSPCTFVIAIDVAADDANLGVRETGYFVWAVGRVWTIRTRLEWQSER